MSAGRALPQAKRRPRNAANVRGCDRTVEGFDVTKRTGRPRWTFPKHPAPDRFWAKVQGGDYQDCWIWTGSLRDGYGRFAATAKQVVNAHRWSYESLIAPVPDGLQLDHVCHNLDPHCLGGSDCRHRRCVNPWHLDPVTRLVNVQRGKGHGSETHCPQGHPYDEQNTDYHGHGRYCRTCQKSPRQAEYEAAYRKRKKALATKGATCSH